MKSQDKIFKDILNFIKCVSGHLHKYEWTHVFMYASKNRCTQKRPKCSKGVFSVVENMTVWLLFSSLCFSKFCKLSLMYCFYR